MKRLQTRSNERGVEIRGHHILSRTRPLGTSLAELAPELGYIALVIETTESPNLVSDVVSILIRNGMEIRQVLADAPDIVPKPKIIVVVAGQLSDLAFAEIIALNHVKGVKILE